LTLIYWLFDGWDDFLATHATISTSTNSHDARPPSGAATPDPRATAFASAISQGKTVTAASRLASISVGTGIAWAAKLGVTTGRRPKKVPASTHRDIVNDLADGKEKADIASRHAVSLQTVTRVLRSEVGLSDLRQLKLQQRKRATARDSWMQALDKAPVAPVAHLRTLAGAAYAWLRRHDPAWLDAHQPQRISVERRPSVDWDQRDVELAGAVREAALRLSTPATKAPLRRWQILQVLPELKAKLSALHRLPLTSRALIEVTRRERRDERQRPL
jgi:hypothetical protein